MILREDLSAWPKVELHRHLEGSLRLSTIADVAAECDLDLPAEEAKLRDLLQVSPGQPKPPQAFLQIFGTIRSLFQSPAIIQRFAREAVEDAAQEGIRYLELRFTPAALCEAKGYPLGEVMDWVVEAVREGSRQTGITVGLLASLNRHESVQLAERMISLVADRIAGGIVGVDLAGDETSHAAEPFAGVLREARQAGLHVTVHAGEWSGPEEVSHALMELGAERIGHGVRVIEDPEAVTLALKRDVVFEIAPTSNLCTGVVAEPEAHPLPAMIQAGLRVTLGTDDPSIFGVRLEDEYAGAINHLGLSLEAVKGMILTAAQGAFLPPREKRDLERELVRAFWEGERVE